MKKISIDAQSSFLLVALLLVLLLLPNGFYLFFPVLVLYILLYQMQQPYKPGIFTLIILQHFLQIAAAVWLCNYLGKDIDYNTDNRSTSIIASSIGLVALMLPVLFIQNKIPPQSRKNLSTYADKFSIQKIMYAYIIAFFAASFLGTIAFIFGGLSQIIISLVKVKWILFLLFGYQSILKNQFKNTFYLFIALEFLSGFLGFFSDFKTVIFFLLVLIIPLFPKLDFKQVFIGLVIGVFLFLFALVWTNIKGEYRRFLNGGTQSQAISTEVTASGSLDKLYDLSTNVNNDKLNATVVDLLDRLQYTYSFAKTIDRVPAVLPFERGRNWLSNLDYATTPRFLNPDKPNYDATEKTRKYTGIRYAGRKEGASFSLGYFPDCYIDFGIFGMMFMLLAIGSLYAVIYSFLLKNSSNNMLFNYCVVGAFFMEFIALEMDGTYLLGRLFSSFITFYFLIKFFFPFLIKYISKAPEKVADSIVLHR